MRGIYGLFETVVANLRPLQNRISVIVEIAVVEVHVVSETDSAERIPEHFAAVQVVLASD